MLQHEKLVLASASQIRRQLLECAGLSFQVHPADLDEAAIKQTFLADQSEAKPSDVAQLLAQTKAVVISELYPGHLVIGSDQILIHEDRILSKPGSTDEARGQLLDLRGKVHELVSAVAVAFDGSVQWSFEDTAHLSMREVSNVFVGSYLAAMGDEITQSVGAYKLEGLGIHLFDEVRGNYHTILGLPMLPLLKFLRSRNTGLV
ncbi:MAG: septum formation inhibitor Maf [Rhodobacteraceae bacterium]|nr:septum formation inhibitor Maf [Paracoccaceae bacterium]